MRYYNIDAKGIKELASALKENTALRTMKLIFNKIDAEGIKAFDEALKENETLATINLRFNEIDNEDELESINCSEGMTIKPLQNS